MALKKFLSSPGYLDVLIILMLVVFSPNTATALYVAGICASLRIILPMLVTRSAMGLSPRGLTYSLIIALLCLGYVVMWGEGWRGTVAAYLGAAAATEILGMFMLKALSNRQAI
ncbi:hypothetical protein [Aquipseudomonas ullengensis]|uniref:Uncharacterized protein n=1 Tax=Aquipseudomonas ullengensis TaxID=2759166 RepID=A0A7W4LQG5_9GAMM|nr:hypothetical protein [Pseudomonas ullengensis]MBB2497454.1 hypothetical protein [Pseudomonas ullengensis]